MHTNKSGETAKTDMRNPAEMLKNGRQIDFAGEKSYA